MIKTKLVQLSYKVKNKIKNNEKSILQKGRSLQQALQIVQKGKNKMLNTEQQPQQVSQWQLSKNLHKVAVTLMIPFNTQLFRFSSKMPFATIQIALRLVLSKFTEV